jgi:hypothetical protein
MELINPFNIPGWTYLCPCCNSKLIPSPEEGIYEQYKRKNTNADKKQRTDADSHLEVPPQKETKGDTQPPDESGGSAEVVFIDDTPPVFFDTAPCLVHAETGSSITQDGSIPSCTNSSHKAINSTPQQHTIEKRQQPNAAVCRFYLKNICKHGISGKGIPGEQCKFSHPRRCAKFTTHGTHQGGCKKGKLCKDFHPPICRDSLKSKLCTNMQCKFTHLKGTKRYEPVNYQQSNKTDHQFGQADTPNIGHNNNDDHAHFLGVLNNLKQELFQMMEQKLSHHAPPRQVMMPQFHQPNHPQQIGTPNQFQFMQPQFTQTTPAQNVNNWPLPMRH